MNAFLLVLAVLVAIVLACMAGYQLNKNKFGGENEK